MDKKLFYGILATAGALFLFNYLSVRKEGPAVPSDVRPGQSYRVPKYEDLVKPVKREIDFVDRKRSKKEAIAVIETDLYSIAFSSYGGVVSSLDFKKHVGARTTPLRTIHTKTFYEQEQGSFLLALDEKTPYFYEPSAVTHDGQTSTIRYQTTTDDWMIRKTYTVEQDSYKVTLDLEFIPLNASSAAREELHPRLFFAAPKVGGLDSDTIEGVVSGVGESAISAVSLNREAEEAWIAPRMFGGEDKYFAHVLINDVSHFVQRAFYKRIDTNNLFAIVEGPALNEKKKYSFIFYLGPKILDELTKVDPKLEALLSFGWLSWICKLLLKLLELLNSYIGNYGFSIIALTILLKLPFFPLSMRSRSSMEKFQRAQPAIARIRQKYKNDMQMMNAEMIRYYKEHTISPFALFTGFLPSLIQLPILFGLYRVLVNYLELYQAPFCFWIVDLSAKDPYYVLPIFMGIFTFLSVSRSSPRSSHSSALRSSLGHIALSLFLTLVFLSFPVGLVLYWTVNSMLTVGEDIVRKKYFA